MLEKLSAPAIGNLEQIAREIRGTTVQMSFRGKAPHLGSSLSCVDILVAAYWHFLKLDPANPGAPDRDRFILSKGHAAQAFYACLAKRGYFDESLLETYNQDGATLAEHPGANCVAGVEAATGSLGHGLPIGVGLAHAAKIKKLNYRVMVLLSDGECNEGSVWEAAMLAPVLNLNNLSAAIDYNKWQATGRSDEVMALGPLVDKWRAFGWQAIEVDGHDMNALVTTLDTVSNGVDQPFAIIAHTVKGKGVTFMEDDNNWHYRVPTEDEVQAAWRELGLI